MINKLISAVLIFLFVSAASSQNIYNAVVLNRNINGGYVHSAALTGYPPNSDVWVIYNPHTQPANVFYTSRVLSLNDRSRVIYIVTVPAAEYTFNSKYSAAGIDPYYKYMNMHHYYPEANSATADLTLTNSSIVKYRNYVRPSEREDYSEINYLAPAPVVTVTANTIVPPHGVNYYKKAHSNKQEPLRDYRADIWNYKDYSNTANSNVFYYSNLDLSNQ